MLHMLDTNTASYVIKGRHAGIQAKLQDLPPSSLCISAVTRAELMFGLKRLSAEHRLHTSVRLFLRIVPTLAWDADAADWYADICHRLQASGRPIGEMDMMIAAHSLSVGAVLVTNNTRHFQYIEAPLMLVNWVDQSQ